MRPKGFVLRTYGGYCSCCLLSLERSWEDISEILVLEIESEDPEFGGCNRFLSRIGLPDFGRDMYHPNLEDHNQVAILEALERFLPTKTIQERELLYPYDDSKRMYTKRVYSFSRKEQDDSASSQSKVDYFADNAFLFYNYQKSRGKIGETQQGSPNIE